MRVVPRVLTLRSVHAVLLAAMVSSLLALPQQAAAEDATPAGQTIVGELVQAWPEHADHSEAAERGTDGPLTWVQTESGDAVRVSTDDIVHQLAGVDEAVPVGATVEVVVGETVDDVAVREQNLAPAHEVLTSEVIDVPPRGTVAAALPHSVTVVRVLPPGGVPDGRSLDDIVAAVNGPVREFWLEQTDGAIDVSAAGVPGEWLSTEFGCDSPWEMWWEVEDAVGFVPAAGKHLMLYIPYNQPALNACAYGLAEVGSDPSSGGFLYVRDTRTSVIAHELGHNFSLGHSSGMQCDGTVDRGTCRINGYDDWYDVMGASWDQIGSLNPPQASRLGVIPAAQQQSLTASGNGGVFTLLPTGGRAGLRVLRLEASDGAIFWLEYRTPVGRDGWLGTGANWPRLESGVLLRREFSGDHGSLLLDATPTPQAGWNDDVSPALPVARSVSFGAAGSFTVTLLSAGPNGASVRLGTAADPEPWTPETNRLPVGNWEVASPDGISVRVSGWAFDPDSPTAPVELHAYADGRGAVLSADRSRPDVGAAFPGAGSAHGYEGYVVAYPGWRSVCVYAIDAQVPWRNTPFGCRAVPVGLAPPTGNWEVLSAVGTSLTVAGWARDPDSPTSSLPVHVYIDGVGRALSASASRPDVGAAFPGGGDHHGFIWSTTVAPGWHTVCVYAIDGQNLWMNTPLGCRPIAVGLALPLGNWEVLSASGTTLTASGWSFDPDSPSAPSEVHLYIDGGGVAVRAQNHRPDVGAVFPQAGPSHGFSWTTSVAPGWHTVCAYAIDAETPWRNTAFGCRAILV